MACVIPARCFFFDECIDDETLGAYFDKKENKSIVSVFFLFCFVFSSTYFLVTASSLSVGLTRLTIFSSFISLLVS